MAKYFIIIILHEFCLHPVNICDTLYIYMYVCMYIYVGGGGEGVYVGGYSGNQVEIKA